MLSIKVCNVNLDNPTVLASGILGMSGKLLVRVAKNGAGAVTTKSISLKERKGHKNPTVLAGKDFLTNAVGLSNPGVKEFMDEIRYAIKYSNVPVIVSIFASTIKEFGLVTKEISNKPDFIEVNISCPNVEDEFGKPFACDEKDVADVTKTVKANTKIPVIVKLSPNVEDIGMIARAVEKAGADAISAINTVGPEKNEFLANKEGGISGPRIRKIALEKVSEIYKSVKLPIIGIGGVTYGKDAIEMIKAGASAVGIGSAVYFRGIDVFKKVCDEMKTWMKANNYKSIDELIGLSHC